MRKLIVLAVAVAAIAAVALLFTPLSDADDAAPAPAPAPIFADLEGDADMIYLMANSSVVFGPDPNGRSEEITFIGPVTVPKWPMKGYDYRQLADGRQEIDMELTDSQLVGHSYLLGGEVLLGEHPDLKSLGTITSKAPQNDIRFASDTTTRDDTSTADATAEEGSETVPADMVVARKVLMTTAKGVLYNETPVPVRGQITDIPPVRHKDQPTGVNVFKGMELPVALLDENGDVNGWFYSKAHMAYAVTPDAVDRGQVEGTLTLTDGERTEKVKVAGPIEFHHSASDAHDVDADVEVLVMALRGTSEILGGDFMIIEGFSDRDRFSEGAWQREAGGLANFDLYMDIYTPSAKLANHQPIPVQGSLTSYQVQEPFQKGQLKLDVVQSTGVFSSTGGQVLFDEAERQIAEVVGLDIHVARR